MAQTVNNLPAMRETWVQSLGGDLPDPGIKPMFLASPALAGRLFTTEPPGEPILMTAILNSLWDNSKIEDKC